MKIINATPLQILFMATLLVFHLWGAEASAKSSYFTSRGCTKCHTAPVAATCNGCHRHGAKSLSAATNKTSYAPGETVTATLKGGSKGGWIKAILYDQNNVQIAVSSGAASGMGGSTTYPATLSAPAPETPGTYTWKMAYYGNKDGSGSRDVHGEVKVNTNSFAVKALDTTKPTLTISALPDGSYTNEVTLNVSGKTSDTGGIKSVSVNGAAVSVNQDGSFSHALTLTTGANTITTTAADNSGNQQADTRIVTYDANLPLLTVAAPPDNSSTTQSFITISGAINETSTVTVKVNDGSPQSAAISGNGFSATVNLTAGVNTIDITSTDLDGKTTTDKRTVNYDNSATGLTLAVTYPAQDITTGDSSLILNGAVVDALGKVTVSIGMDGKSYSPKVVNGVFQQRISFTKAKLYTISVTARDEAGNSGTVTRNVIYRTLSNSTISTIIIKLMKMINLW